MQTSSFRPWCMAASWHRRQWWHPFGGTARVPPWGGCTSSCMQKGTGVIHIARSTAGRLGSLAGVLYIGLHFEDPP